jgi:hypothetical protein
MGEADFIWAGSEGLSTVRKGHAVIAYKGSFQLFL